MIASASQAVRPRRMPLTENIDTPLLTVLRLHATQSRNGLWIEDIAGDIHITTQTGNSGHRGRPITGRFRSAQGELKARIFECDQVKVNSEEEDVGKENADAEEQEAAKGES